MQNCREASSSFHNSAPCSSKYMYVPIELLQGVRAIMELSCKRITAMCLWLLADQTCFHKLAGLLNQSNKGLCLQRKHRLWWNSSRKSAQEGTNRLLSVRQFPEGWEGVETDVARCQLLDWEPGEGLKSHLGSSRHFPANKTSIWEPGLGFFIRPLTCLMTNYESLQDRAERTQRCPSRRCWDPARLPSRFSLLFGNLVGPPCWYPYTCVNGHDAFSSLCLLLAAWSCQTLLTSGQGSLCLASQICRVLNNSVLACYNSKRASSTSKQL